MGKNKLKAGPNAKRKAAQRRAMQAKFFGLLFVLLAVLSGGYWLYLTFFPKVYSTVSGTVKQKIAINGFDIRGTEGLDSARLAEYLTLSEAANILNTSSREIEHNIAGIQGVESVKVRKKPFSQEISVRITQRTAKYKVNINNELHWADRNGWVWQGVKNNDAAVPLVFGLRIIEENGKRRIDADDFKRLEKTFARIRGTGKNSDNIKTIFFRENDVTEFTASNISVPVRMNGTLRYGTDDFEYFERVLRQKNRTPLRYLDAYENCIYSM